MLRWTLGTLIDTLLTEPVAVKGSGHRLPCKKAAISRLPQRTESTLLEDGGATRSHPTLRVPYPPQLSPIWKPYPEAARALGARLTNAALGPGRSSGRLDELGAAPAQRAPRDEEAEERWLRGEDVFARLA